MPESDSDDYPSTSLVVNFQNRQGLFATGPSSAAIGNLYGCTALVVISELGVYFAKFSEYPSMRGKSTPEAQNEVFENEVLGFLMGGRKVNFVRDGRSQYPGLKQFTSKRSKSFKSLILFPQDTASFLIVTPEDPDGSDAARYERYVEKIKDVTMELLGGDAMYSLHTYPRLDKLKGYPGTKNQEELNNFVDALGDTAYGKVVMEWKSSGYEMWVMENGKPSEDSIWY